MPSYELGHVALFIGGVEVGRGIAQRLVEVGTELVEFVPASDVVVLELRTVERSGILIPPDMPLTSPPRERIERSYPTRGAAWRRAMKGR